MGKITKSAKIYNQHPIYPTNEMLPLALICDQPSDNDNELSVFKYSSYLGIPLQSTDNSKLKFNLPIYITK